MGGGGGGGKTVFSSLLGVYRDDREDGEDGEDGLDISIRITLGDIDLCIHIVYPYFVKKYCHLYMYVLLSAQIKNANYAYHVATTYTLNNVTAYPAPALPRFARRTSFSGRATYSVLECIGSWGAVRGISRLGGHVILHEARSAVFAS
jgi:hypothetical protein